MELAQKLGVYAVYNKTHSVTTLTQRVQHKVDTPIKCLQNLLFFNNNCSTRTQTLFATTSGFILISSLVRANYSHIYWRNNSNESFLHHIKFKIRICY